MKFLMMLVLVMSVSITAQARKSAFSKMMESMVAPAAEKGESAGSTESNPQNTGRGNQTIKNFGEAKKLINKEKGLFTQTLYCGCDIENQKKVNFSKCGYVPPVSKKGTVSSRAGKIEQEHLVDASSLGRSFKEWRDYKTICGPKSNGRKCAGTNKEFARMESDIHNLWSEDGLTNLLRSNKTHQMLQSSDYSFGKCDIKLTESGFLARPEVRGTIARTLQYMDWAYPGRGIISGKNKPLYEAWSKMYKATPLECTHNKLATKIQGNPNPFAVEACKAAGLSY